MRNPFVKRLWRPIVGLSLGLALSPMPVLAETAGIEDGLYDGYSCAAEESDQRIELEKGTATFYDHVCKLSNPRALDGVDGAVLLTADCDGDGGPWSEGMVLLQTKNGGLSMLNAQWGDHYERCE